MPWTLVLVADMVAGLEARVKSERKKEMVAVWGSRLRAKVGYEGRGVTQGIEEKAWATPLFECRRGARDFPIPRLKLSATSGWSCLSAVVESVLKAPTTLLRHHHHADASYSYWTARLLYARRSDHHTTAMTSSSAGSTAFFALSLLAICGLVLLLLRYYLPLRTTPSYVLVPIFLTVALPASIILLVPIDLASSAGTDTDGSRGIWLSDKVVYKSWRITYWLTFALTWFILPLLGEYCDSGYREPRARFMYSLRTNAHYQLMMLGCGILGAVYFFLQNGFNFTSFKGVVMALAYAWGLVLAIYLMGHGLVAFPRMLYRYGSISGRLKRLQSHAPKVHDKLTEALEKLDQYEYQVLQLKQRKHGTAREFQEWIEELSEMSSLPESRVGVVGRTSTSAVPPVITERYLADLTRKLKRARHAKMRFSDEWDRLVRKAIKTQAILDSKGSQRLDFKNSPALAPQPGLLSRFTLLTPYSRYHVYVHVIPALSYLASFVCTLASMCVIWSECIRSPKFSLIGRTVIHHPDSARGQIGFAGQVIAAAWLCYMCICAFFSLTEVKIWGNRALVRRGTYQESATWYGLQVAKLTVPLAYNFVTFTPPNIYRNTSYHKFLGSLIESTPVGANFSTYFPVFVCIPVLASLFGLYGRIRTICGFGDLLEDEEDATAGDAGTGSWREGRALIDREVQGANGNVLGLSQRGPTSPPNERYSDQPPPPLANGEASAPSRQRPERRRPPITDDDEDGGNFFESFGARVKNTFETTDFSFSRPKWLGGDEEGDENDEPARGRRREGGGDRTQGWTSLFGGRSEEGRVRL
ncbi:LMBR1-like membrane protein-domain-containing protein [Massariosphaeria phaeospora]|uniref:LMBR1-like membrane protein-domain-containing protein n=1 Tax=Massariosphaeria phaeospora TaxID=100035 RepID=A0A7C8IBJ6_9PLEO|nr:LMBR1-like membrane protein-domain-containing protein [Massariosphaeria phaeospora]